MTIKWQMLHHAPREAGVRVIVTVIVLKLGSLASRVHWLAGFIGIARFIGKNL